MRTRGTVNKYGGIITHLTRTKRNALGGSGKQTPLTHSCIQSSVSFSSTDSSSGSRGVLCPFFPDITQQTWKAVKEMHAVRGQTRGGNETQPKLLPAVPPATNHCVQGATTVLSYAVHEKREDLGCVCACVAYPSILDASLHTFRCWLGAPTGGTHNNTEKP